MKILKLVLAYTLVYNVQCVAQDFTHFKIDNDYIWEFKNSSMAQTFDFYDKIYGGHFTASELINPNETFKNIDPKSVPQLAINKQTKNVYYMSGCEFELKKINMAIKNNEYYLAFDSKSDTKEEKKYSIYMMKDNKKILLQSFEEFETDWNTHYFSFTSDEHIDDIILEVNTASRNFRYSHVFENSKIEINAYPNPTTGLVTLTIPNSFVGESLSIYSPSSQLVYQIIMSDRLTNIDMGFLSSGLYVLYINDQIKPIQILKK